MGWIDRWLLNALPKRTLTVLVGAVARRPASRHLIRWYIKHYQIDVSEIALPLREFGCLLDFFCRRVLPAARPVDDCGLSSPVDGTVSQYGVIDNGTLVQAKGYSYQVCALLGGDDWGSKFACGSFITVYLSPRDYHRIHMPCAGTVVFTRHIPGRLFPVYPRSVHAIRGLYTANERVISVVESSVGDVAIVKIGATVVGSVRTRYDEQHPRPSVPDWHRSRNRRVRTRPVHLHLQRGEELAHFALGSTVILLLPAGVVKEWTVDIGQRVRVGSRIAHTSESTHL